LPTIDTNHENAKLVGDNNELNESGGDLSTPSGNSGDGVGTIANKLGDSGGGYQEKDEEQLANTSYKVL
jgi:hypothetical protein